MANIETLKVDTFNFAEQGSPPATPASGQVVVYAGSDNHLYAKNDLGQVFDLTAGAASSQVAAAKVYAYTTFRTAR